MKNPPVHEELEYEKLKSQAEFWKTLSELAKETLAYIRETRKRESGR